MRFQVRALRGDGNITIVSVDARDARDADRLAEAQGLEVLSVRASSWAVSSLVPSRARFPLLLFSQELFDLLDAGISLVEAIETLAEKEMRRETRSVLDRVVATLREGKTLSRSLEEIPEAFPPLFVAIVRSSERTGSLGEALTRYSAYESQLTAVRNRLVSGLIYPAVLVFVGVLVTLFLLGYIVPKFSQVYEDLGENLPAYSQWMVGWGHLVREHGIAMLGALGAIAVLTVSWLGRPQTRAALVARIWRLPALGERMRIYQLARFYRSLGMLLRGGVSIIPALEMVVGMLQPTLRTRLEQASRAIREGSKLSLAMEEHGLTTSVAVRMLRVGERSGRMGDMMERIARFYDEEQARWIDWFTKLFEPTVMAFIGLLIGGIVLLMYMPILGLAVSVE